MPKAIGMIEFKTVSAGVTATDQMVKAADVDLIEAQTVCPGKYIAIIAGELSAVRSAVERGKITRGDELISSFVLGNPDDALFPAIYGTVTVEDARALGILETYDAASIFVAADIAAKTAVVNLIEIRVAKGMCGKSYVMLTGEVAACEAAIAAAKAEAAERGMYLDSSVISGPDRRLWKTIL